MGELVHGDQQSRSHRVKRLVPTEFWKTWKLVERCHSSHLELELTTVGFVPNIAQSLRCCRRNAVCEVVTNFIVNVSLEGLGDDHVEYLAFYSESRIWFFRENSQRVKLLIVMRIWFHIVNHPESIFVVVLSSSIVEGVFDYILRIPD